MKHLPFKTALLMAVLVAFSRAAVADPPVVTLNGITAVNASPTTFSAGNATSVDVSVASAAGGAYTVLLETRFADATGFPWVLAATFANCDASGIGTVTPVGGSPTSSVPCVAYTLTPSTLMRLRCSARSSGTIYGAFHANRNKP